MALTNAERQAAYKAKKSETIDILTATNAALLADNAKLRDEVSKLKDEKHKLEIAVLKAKAKK
jgi:hypothetical protein